MKLNSKGITLVELIVSFAIVSVAIIYFFQTLTTVNKLYKISREETNMFVKKTYALKLIDTRLNKQDDIIKKCVIEKDNNTVEICNLKRGGFTIYFESYKVEKVDEDENNNNNNNYIYKIYIKDSRNGPAYATLYKCIPPNISTES